MARVQRWGTGGVGRVFGPVMIVWFSVLGVVGLVQVVGNPGVLAAVNPVHAVAFFLDNGGTGFFALGSVFLVVTGGEALYADMGHFGHRPIGIGWFSFVLPGLVLNDLGQGALLIARPEAIDNPFSRLAPSWAVVPLLLLATVATVIASQALISGAVSLTMQASQLGYLPRVRIIHTSARERGQIYVPRSTGCSWSPASAWSWASVPIPGMAPPPLLYNFRSNGVRHEEILAVTVVTDRVRAGTRSSGSARRTSGTGCARWSCTTGSWSSRTWRRTCATTSASTRTRPPTSSAGRRWSSPTVPAWPGGASACSPTCGATPRPPGAYFDLPTDRVIEISAQVEL